MKSTFLWAVPWLAAASLPACTRDGARPRLLVTAITPGTTVVGGSALNAAVIGDTLAVQGRNFSAVAADNRVSIGAASVPVLGATPTELQVVVPAGTPFAYVEVTVGREGYEAAVGTISVRSRPSPVITGIRPTAGRVGTVLTIRGRHLTETYDDNLIAFPSAQGQEAQVIVRPFQPVLATADSIQVVVPAGAGTGRVSLYARPAENSRTTFASLVTPVFTVTP